MKLRDEENGFGLVTRRRGKHRFTFWLAAIELSVLFVLADAGTIAWTAGLMSGEQLLAASFAYTSVAAGLLFTGYQFEHGFKTIVTATPRRRVGARVSRI